MLSERGCVEGSVHDLSKAKDRLTPRRKERKGGKEEERMAALRPSEARRLY
jgi:hypothetical protein